MNLLKPSNWTIERAECDVHGVYEAEAFKGKVRGGCPKCIAIAAEEARVRQEAEAAAQMRQAMLERANLRGRFCETTFASFEASTNSQRAALAACEAYVDTLEFDQGGGLWLLGPVGTGKSHLGAAMANACVFERKRSAVLMTAREIVRELRATWGRDGEGSEEQVIDHLGDVPLLVLDEVGVGFGSEAEQVQLFDVIDRRYQLGRPTVLLSNLNVPALRVTLGARLFDRLREGSKVLLCDWPSHRAPAEGA